MRTALFIPFHNRAEYLAKCLQSLPRSGATVFLINDASTEPDVIPVCKGYTVHNLPKNRGIKGALQYGYEYCFSKGYQRVINLDSDMIVTPDFFTRLLELSDKFPDEIISGFNSSNDEINPILSKHRGYVVKRHANGCALCVTKSAYEKYVKPALSLPGNWDFNVSKRAKSCIVAVPSISQHIGVVSSMGHNVGQECAADFPKIKLPNVTLFGIDAHDPIGIIRAAKISIQHIDFGDVQIITKRLFKGREGYSTFCIKEMWRYIKTDYVLIIHPDGYIQNPWAWDDNWLQWDYLGATWCYKDGQNVGNGGFSLRSRRLLNAIKDFDLPKDCIEDDFICRAKRKHLEHAGMKFAPDEVANKFSIEAYGAKVFTDTQGIPANQYTGQFGFHGYAVKGLPVPPNPKVK